MREGIIINSRIKNTTSLETTPDVEVLHAAQKSCNACVSCNTHFLAGYRPAHCPLSLKLMLYYENMECVLASASSAQFLIIQTTTDGHPAHFPPVMADRRAVVEVSKEDASVAKSILKLVRLSQA